MTVKHIYMSEAETIEAVKALLGRAASNADDELLYKQGVDEAYLICFDEEEDLDMENATEMDVSQRIEELNKLYAAFGEATRNIGLLKSEKERMAQYLPAFYAYQDAYTALLAGGVNLGFADGQYCLMAERELEHEQED